MDMNRKFDNPMNAFDSYTYIDGRSIIYEVDLIDDYTYAFPLHLHDDNTCSLSQESENCSMFREAAMIYLSNQCIFSNQCFRSLTDSSI